MGPERSVVHRLSSGPFVMPNEPSLPGNLVCTPAVVIREMLFVPSR